MIYYDRPTKFASDVEERIMSAVHELMPKEFLASRIKSHPPHQRLPSRIPIIRTSW